MNEKEIEVEVDLEEIHSKRRRAFFDNEVSLHTRGSIVDSLGEDGPHDCSLTQENHMNPIDELMKHSNIRVSNGTITNYKLYHFWKGNNNFCMEGKFLNGLKKRSLKSRMTLTLILISFGMYLVFPAFYLYDNISPFITLITIYTFILTIFFYFMTLRYVSINPVLIQGSFRNGRFCS